MPANCHRISDSQCNSVVQKSSSFPRLSQSVIGQRTMGLQNLRFNWGTIINISTGSNNAHTTVLYLEENISLTEVLAAGRKMDLREMQKFQSEHDVKYHAEIASWPVKDQIEHCTLHLAKLAGMFSSYCEKVQMNEAADSSLLFTERIPDILIFALKMATLADMDIEEAYLDRIRKVEKRQNG